MNKLLSAASVIAIVTAGSAAQAAVVLTDENLDTVTAGAANTDFNAMSIVLPGATLIGQCVGNNCTINVNGVIYNNFSQLVVNQSGITVTDALGHRMQWPWPMTWPSSTFSTVKSLVVPLRS